MTSMRNFSASKNISYALGPSENGSDKTASTSPPPPPQIPKAIAFEIGKDPSSQGNL